jgi:transcriptional regulator with XRE-family HTH domain
MNGIGIRLREERDRLGLSQKAFGEIGGVEPNAQGKYEGGHRAPKADYLAAVARSGVDVLYVLTGTRTPVQLDRLSQVEEWVLGSYRSLEKEDQDAIRRLTTTLAEFSTPYAVQKKPLEED